MQRKKITIIAVFLLLPLYSNAQIIINEISWMSGYDEWIELYNNGEENVSLDGWTITIDEKTTPLEGILSKDGFYIIERTDDNSLPDIEAGGFFTGSIKNTGAKIELYDDQGNLIDSADFSRGWVYGNNETKQTAERASLGKWQTSAESGGTPGKENSIITVQEQKKSIDYSKNQINYAFPLLISFCLGLSILAIKLDKPA